jgi:uncharacterized pyridoxal phosphate-containing UPF0001 family protein
MSISTNLQQVSQALAGFAQEAGRNPQDIVLLAVSKTFGADAVIAAAQAGQRAFGENYVQEAVDKIAAVREAAPGLALEWHFIGPLQSNKTKPVAEHFDWVHAVDREKIAQRLSDQRPSNLPPLNICLQVNVVALPNLRLRGLMAIPEPAATLAAQREPFAQLRKLQEQLRAEGIETDTLSMGMSADMQAAILEGASIVRIGTAIFGKRDYAN